MTLSRRAFVAAFAGAVLMPDAAEALPLFDVVVYGGTPSGVMAAYAAAREGASVILVQAGPLGGVVANGLGSTDLGRGDVIGGLCRDLFVRNGRRYGYPIKKSFHPAVAESLFREYLDEAGVTRVAKGFLREAHVWGGAVRSIILTTGTAIRGRAFIDASYEGDLMAFAGCQHRIGRESRAEFNEPLAGFNAAETLRRYRTHDDAGRLFPLLSPMPSTPRYAADHRVQAYGFRLCVTDDRSNMVRFPRPKGYDPDRFLFEIHRLNGDTGFLPGFDPSPLGDGKFDLNGHYLGGSWDWPGGTWARRRAIFDDHVAYHAGLIYTMAHDRRVPVAMRERVNAYGLAKDEFTDHGHWPRQLYVREARRLRGLHVMRQQDTQTDVAKLHPVCLGSYSLDNHGTAIFAVRENTVNIEGFFTKGKATSLYQIPYECLVPRTVDNLLVSVCVSATQVAMCSMRMEPQYMMMGEAAGLAAAHVARDRIRARDLKADVSRLLKARGAKLSLPKPATGIVDATL